MALDTFPYNGTTTTCEALWMGVPVVTLAGERHAARVGASLLSAVGFPAGIAERPADYVMTARLLAEQRQLLAALRANLRADMARSPLVRCGRPRPGDRGSLSRRLAHLVRRTCRLTAVADGHAPA